MFTIILVLLFYVSVDELNKESSFERQLALCKNELRKKAKAVHFDDYLDNSANGHMGTLRRKFRDEERKTRIRKEVCFSSNIFCNIIEIRSSNGEVLGVRVGVNS